MNIRKAATSLLVAAFLIAPLGADAQGPGEAPRTPYDAKVKLPAGALTTAPLGKTPGGPRPTAPEDLVEALRLNGVTVYDFDTLPAFNSSASPFFGSFERLIDRWETIKRPASPREGANVLRPKLERLRESCLQGRNCSEASALGRVVQALNDASTAYPDCSSAAVAYGAYYLDNGEPPADIARRYDLACLGSLEPRRVQGAEQRDALPAVYTAGGREGAAEGAFRAIGLLEADGIPFCAGLLRNDRTLVTARHCFEGPEGAFWQAGRVKVRPVDGRGGPWAIGSTLIRSGAAKSQAVPQDWAVVAIATTDPIAAPRVELAPRELPGEVTVLSYFRHHAHAEYGQGASAEPWRKGLRWPRPGLCQVEQVEPGCLRLVCQTVRGFSGAPVFDASPPPSGEPIKVVGFISQAATTPLAACGARSSVVTLAAAAVQAAP
jgi:V8-like Glu-specific endopeptidase